MGCGRVDSAWCPRCEDDLNTLPLQLEERLLGGKIPIIATGDHVDKLQAAIQALKYENIRALYMPLGNRLIAAMQTLNWSPDGVLPVPLHTERQQQRGYNQAHLLAAYLSDALCLPYHPQAITRTRNTPPQVGLSRQQRLQNMRGAFSADAQFVHGQNILFIDDVCTTGATLAACAQAALKAGALHVAGLTVSMAVQT